jgi:trans-aconitate 2-methyltransferase
VSTTRDWDATTYDRVSGPQQRWAAEQLDRLELAGDEVVVDAAPSMVRHTQEAVGDRATALCQDLVMLDLPEPVDVVFSNATFHWIGDHDALFGALARNMKPGARLLAQCGGKGNIDRFRVLADEIAFAEPFAPYFTDWVRPWNYATAEETAERLERAGFRDISTWLEEKPTPLQDPRPFISTVCLVRHLDPLPPELRAPFIDSVLERYGTPVVLDYVRLNMTARRA